jgi:hypothetical protein
MAWQINRSTTAGTPNYRIPQYERWRRTPRRPGRRRRRARAEIRLPRSRPASAFQRGSLERLKAIEAEADFQGAIAAAERDGPRADVDPRVHRAMIDAQRSELQALREFLAEAC